MPPDMNIANGTWNGRHFREQLVSERFGQPRNEVAVRKCANNTPNAPKDHVS